MTWGHHKPYFFTGTSVCPLAPCTSICPFPGFSMIQKIRTQQTYLQRVHNTPLLLQYPSPTSPLPVCEPRLPKQNKENCGAIFLFSMEIKSPLPMHYQKRKTNDWPWYTLPLAGQCICLGHPCDPDKQERERERKRERDQGWESLPNPPH